MALFDDEDPADVPPAPGAASAEPSQSNMLALALLGLGSTGVGALMGGRQGAMIGAQQGALAGAGAMNTQVKMDEERRKDERAAKRAEEISAQRLEDAKDLEDYKAKNRPIKNAAGEIINVNGEVIDATKTPQKPQKAAAAAKSSEPQGKEIRDRAFQGGKDLTQKTQAYVNAIDAADTANELATLGKTNPIAANALIIKLARASGDTGVLSDSDKKQFGGSMAVDAQFQRMIEKSSAGKPLTDEDLGFARELASRLRDKGVKGYNDTVDNAVSSFTSIYKTSPEETRKMFGARNYQRSNGSEIKVYRGQQYQKVNGGWQRVK
jgi:hypothetical protein